MYLYFASQISCMCLYSHFQSVVLLLRVCLSNCWHRRVIQANLMTFYDAHMLVNGIGYCCAMSFTTCVSIIRLFNGIFYRNHQNGYLWLMVALFRCCCPPVCLFMTFFACHPVQWQCVSVCVCVYVFGCELAR